jgi:hypothetical protein
VATKHRLKRTFPHIAIARPSRSSAFHYGFFEYRALGCKAWASKLPPEIASPQRRRNAIDFRLNSSVRDVRIIENQTEERQHFQFAFNHCDSRCNDMHPK